MWKLSPKRPDLRQRVQPRFDPAIVSAEGKQPVALRGLLDLLQSIGRRQRSYHYCLPSCRSLPIGLGCSHLPRSRHLLALSSSRKRHAWEFPKIREARSLRFGPNFSTLPVSELKMSNARSSQAAQKAAPPAAQPADDDLEPSAVQPQTAKHLGISKNRGHLVWTQDYRIPHTRTSRQRHLRRLWLTPRPASQQSGFKGPLIGPRMGPKADILKRSS